MTNDPLILVFGGGELQLSIIQKCKNRKLFTVVIDPDASAPGKEIADSFVKVAGDDFDGTCAIVEKNGINAIITSATDKPLVMMARIAQKYNFPFYTVDTAINSTDKFLMKEIFNSGGIPCAKGFLRKKPEGNEQFPLIVKPRDNSGSRGVVFCNNVEELESAIEQATLLTKMDSVLIEEFVDGKEYSIETVHLDGKTNIIQFTEKLTSAFPYNVEMGHIAPADLDSKMKEEIQDLMDKISLAFKFENCVSHTELKIKDNKIVLIETSPRLGGDFITSRLVPLSTGIDIEDLLIDISLGKKELSFPPSKEQFTGIFYLDFPIGIVTKINSLEPLNEHEWLLDFNFKLKEGDYIGQIKSSLDRYGSILLTADSFNQLLERKELIFDFLKNHVQIEKYAIK